MFGRWVLEDLDLGMTWKTCPLERWTVPLWHGIFVVGKGREASLEDDCKRGRKRVNQEGLEQETQCHTPKGRGLANSSSVMSSSVWEDAMEAACELGARTASSSTMSSSEEGSIGIRRPGRLTQTGQLTDGSQEQLIHILIRLERIILCCSLRGKFGRHEGCRWMDTGDGARTLRRKRFCFVREDERGPGRHVVRGRDQGAILS